MMTDDEEFFFLNNLFLRECPVCGVLVDEDEQCLCDDYTDEDFINEYDEY